jgi:hypothetical protein
MSELLSVFEGSVFGFVIGASSVVSKFLCDCTAQIEATRACKVAYPDNRVGEFDFGHETVREFVIFEVFPETFGSLGDFGMDEGEFPADFEEGGLGFGGVEIRPPAGAAGSPVAGLDDVIHALVEGQFGFLSSIKKPAFHRLGGLRSLSASLTVLLSTLVGEQLTPERPEGYPSTGSVCPALFL